MTSDTPPRRRWFRFSLRTMFVVVTVVAIGVWGIGKWRDGLRWVILGVTDPMSSYALEGELKSNNIEFRFDGDKRWIIMVHRRDAERAERVLLNSRASGPRQIEFYDKDWDH